MASCATKLTLAKAAASAVKPMCKFSHYRRSTTSKAPRKRTFIANMEKVLTHRAQMDSLARPTVFTAAAVDERSAASCYCWGDKEVELLSGGSDGGNSNNNNNNKGRGGDDSSSFGPSGSGGFIPKLLAVLPQALGVAALFSIIFPVAPSLALASMSSSISSSGSGATARVSKASAAEARRRSRVIHVALDGSTMVVPLSGAGSTLAGVSPSRRVRILEASVELTKEEQRSIFNSQYHVRECVRV